MRFINILVVSLTAALLAHAHAAAADAAVDAAHARARRAHAKQTQRRALARRRSLSPPQFEFWVYAAPNGSDANSGRSPSSPVATPKAAFDVVASIYRQYAPLPQTAGDIHVRFVPGTYELDSTLSVSGDACATPSNNSASW